MKKRPSAQPRDLPPLTTFDGELTGYDVKFEDDPPAKNRVMAEVADEDDEEPDEPVSAPVQTSLGQPVRRRALVDDDDDTLDLLRAALTQANAVVTAASSAEDAIQAFGLAEFDVIVSDIAMPGEDGYQLIEQIRKSGFDRGTIPAVAITAYAKEEDREKAFSAGYQGFLAKPIELSDLVTAITAAVASTGY